MAIYSPFWIFSTLNLVKARFRSFQIENLRNGNTVEKTFRAGETIGRAIIDNRGVQYLYASGQEHVFMDNETYDQFSLTSERWSGSLTS